MTDKQRQRIHDIEYSCDSREELAERIVALEDENAKLLETGIKWMAKAARLESENAKLREFVRVVWDAALHPETFGDGSYLLSRMRDLGIEVDV